MFGDDERVSVSKVTSENAWAKAVNGKNRLARAVELRTSKELKKVQGKAKLQVRSTMTADVLVLTRVLGRASFSKRFLVGSSATSCDLRRTWTGCWTT